MPKKILTDISSYTASKYQSILIIFFSFRNSLLYLCLLSSHSHMNYRILLIGLLSLWAAPVVAQNTEIKGFADFNTIVTKDNASFYLFEQDLFITSDISDRISFLGETVFKYSAPSATNFNVSIERIVIKYNIKGNHNILFGKHHTPVSYWNDVYHHGRVFFPTVNRPEIFTDHVLEIHTTGIGFQGLNLGKHNFGYQVMVGNGIGSTDFRDNDNFKSLTADLHMKPNTKTRFGITAYYDQFTRADMHSHDPPVPVDSSVHFKQLLNGAYFAHFGNTFELLTEADMVTHQTEESGTTMNTALYVYAGVRPWKKIKLVPYVRYDFARYAEEDLFFTPGTKHLFVGGARYEFNYLAVAKLEYNYAMPQVADPFGSLLFQIAVGF